MEVLLEVPIRRIRIFEYKKRSSLRLTVDCNDEKVHESLVASKSSSRLSRKEIIARTEHRLSVDSCTTEITRLVNNHATPLLVESFSLRSESPESRPIERAVEARNTSEDGLGSMVRCLHFAETYIANRK